VRVPRECYQLLAELDVRLPALRPAQRLGLAVWVYGAVLAGSACQGAVLTALLPVFATLSAARQYLREWCYDGTERAAPCNTHLEVSACFAPVLRWVLRWWQGQELALAIDATLLGDKVAVLTVAVLYRGGAIPVAWHVLPANQAGAWMPPILKLLERLAPAVPAGWTVLVLSDRGLWSRQLWDAIRTHRWHPLMRVRREATFAPLGHRRRRADTLIPGPGHAWVGAGTAFKHRDVRRQGTLLVVWDAAQAEPWLVLTDLPPAGVGVCWYGLRVWVELGFRALKGMGWHWERTRRTDPDRVARHWLVLAVATLWTLATGTRAEDAEAAGLAPAHLRTPPAPPAPPAQRDLSVFQRGLAWLRWQLIRQRRLWRRCWLLPEHWPSPPAGLVIHHDVPPVAPVQP
jgi:hypothetical protein